MTRNDGLKEKGKGERGGDNNQTSHFKNQIISFRDAQLCGRLWRNHNHPTSARSQMTTEAENSLKKNRKEGEEGGKEEINLSRIRLISEKNPSETKEDETKGK